MEELWRTTELNDKYEVSNLGRVRSRHRVLKPYLGRHNYHKVQLGYRGPRVYVHTLVALTFIGPRPTNHHVDHIDFDRHNNAMTNLRYLPAAVNSVRWAGRRADGGNVWALTAEEEPPEDYAPLDPEEAEEIASELASSGW